MILAEPPAIAFLPLCVSGQDQPGGASPTPSPRPAVFTYNGKPCALPVLLIEEETQAFDANDELSPLGVI